MSAAQKLIGKWRADLDRFGQVNPEMAELDADELEMFIGNMMVEITEDKLIIEGYGGGRKERTYTVQEASGDTLVIEARRAAGDTGTYEVEFLDDDHVTMTLTAPIHDAMALVRA